MMNTVKIKDKTFRVSIPEAEIRKSISVVADRLNKDMADKKPLFLAVLNGSFVFAADLMRMITIPCEISFVKLASIVTSEGSTPSFSAMIGVISFKISCIVFNFCV